MPKRRAGRRKDHLPAGRHASTGPVRVVDAIQAPGGCRASSGTRGTGRMRPGTRNLTGKPRGVLRRKRAVRIGAAAQSSRSVTREIGTCPDADGQACRRCTRHGLRGSDRGTASSRSEQPPRSGGGDSWACKRHRHSKPSTFPEENLAPFGMEAQHPDQFIRNLFDLSPDEVLAAARHHRESLTRPRKTVAEYLEMLRREGLTEAAAVLRLHDD